MVVALVFVLTLVILASKWSFDGGGSLLRDSRLSVMATYLKPLSRIYLGVHYPSDIIGGYFASGCWLAAGIWVYQYYREKHYEKRLG